MKKKTFKKNKISKKKVSKKKKSKKKASKKKKVYKSQKKSYKRVISKKKSNSKKIKGGQISIQIASFETLSNIPDKYIYKKISQRKNFDCYVACLAMFINKDYDYIKNTYFKEIDFNISKGLRTSDAENVLQREHRKYTIVNKTFNLNDFEHIKNNIENIPMIITVKSLNYKNGLHVVFWYNELFDPNTEKRNKNKKVKIYNKNLLKKEFQLGEVRQIII